VVRMDKVVIVGVVLVCVIAGVGVGYVLGHIVFPLPVERSRHQWAALLITGLNFTASYTVYWALGQSIPITNVNGPHDFSLNITRPSDVPVGKLWYIEVWARITQREGYDSPLTYETVTIMVDSPTSNGDATSLRAYGMYPAEAHLSIGL
jgi:hypothetical protein